MKSLSGQQNHRHPILIPNHGNGVGAHRPRDENTKSEGDQEDSEVEYGNVSGHKGIMRQKIELQGEFKKIIYPTFDGEVEEVVEAWLINMNKYFQIYKYDNTLKDRLMIY